VKSTHIIERCEVRLAPIDNPLPSYRPSYASKMKDLSSVESLAIPEGVDIKLKSRVVTVTGPRGTLTKAVKHIQMDIQIVS
jgi:hypothetical protein